MSENPLETQVMQLLSDICGDPALDLDIRLTQDLDLDALEHRQLLNALNRHFEIDLTPNDLNLASCDTVEGLCRLVQLKIQP